MKKYINEIIKDDYKNWSIGDLILINAGTGAGKSYFVKNTLNAYCKENNKKILYLTNRSTLKQQVKNDIGEESNITVMNYQKIEQFILKNVTLDNFDYIICDECHYFFTDAGFNNKTDLFLPLLLNDNAVTKIFMTATPKLLKSYLHKEKIEIDYTYELETDYSYLNEVVAFSTYESIDTIIENIKNDEQIIFFSSAKRALEVAQKYKGAFICSKYNKDGLYDKYIKDTEDEKELQRIIETGEFKNHLLCTTTCLDNGVNIKENTTVRHIIIDIFDRDTFIQCLGRKRVSEGEKVNLYFYSWEKDGQRLSGFMKKADDSLERARILFNEGEEVYINTKFKNDKFIDGRIIDDVIGKDRQLHKQVNKCVYQKYYSDLCLYKTITEKEYYTTFKDIIALNLKIDVYKIIDLEVTEEKLTLEETLNSIVGKKLFKDDRKELIDLIGLKDGRGRLQKSAGQLNEYFRANKLNYIIDIPDRKSYRDKDGKIKKEKTYWVVCKIVNKI
ncbi:DEAD/DEAH box helicase family protein [Clostridium sporogenes]